MDLHTDFLLEEYDALQPLLRRLYDQVLASLEQALRDNNLEVTSVSARIKKRESLAGKLALKGSKYTTVTDITDLLGARIITYYTDDVDRIASIVEQLFDIDWENTIDKRRLHDLDSFGYNSMHYICRLPKSMVDDPDCPQLNTLRFELQLRTTVQHAWAAIYHDIGYKTGVEILRTYQYGGGFHSQLFSQTRYVLRSLQ